MNAMATFYNNKNIENELTDVRYDFDTKVMIKDRVKYYSYLITSFNGERYLVPIDCDIFLPYIRGTFQKSITSNIINLIYQVNGEKDVTCYPLLTNDIFTFDIKVRKIEVKNNYSVTYLNKDDTIKELGNSATIKLRNSDELFKLLSDEKPMIEKAVKDAEYESIENPFTKWWMEKDAEEDLNLNNEDLKTERDTFGL